MSLIATLAAFSLQQVPPTDSRSAAPSQLEDVEVTAEARTDMAREFVGRVAAPSRRRGLARWRFVCPGVVNLEAEAARSIADRIAEVANELGIEVRDPGCTANIVIVFTSEARAVAQAMVENDPRVYHQGIGALNRGGAALRDYQESDRPVRWWLLSVPIDSETGQRAVRVRGDPTGAKIDARTANAIGCLPDDCAIGAAPIIVSNSASRLRSQIVDQLYKAIIIVDIEQVAGLNTAQLGDYLAMVSLAQIDPEGETGSFDTVLNLFENRGGVTGLTAWDETYLKALYGSYTQRRTTTAQAGAVAAIMNRTLEEDGAAD